MPDLQPLLREKMAGFVRRHHLLHAGDRLGVAVSGGADSTALLRLLLELRAELGLVLSVIHFNHCTRGPASDGDAEFTRELAERHGLAFHLGSGDVPRYAREHHLSLESAARQMRYGYFRQLLDTNRVMKIATAHTLDDQAETVLLRLIRGAGTKGLAGIYPRLSLSASGWVAGEEEAGELISGQVVRPLLAITRHEVEQYLRHIGQGWREDASNRELKHARNRVRHRLLPLLEQEFNPAIRQVLADTAGIARDEEQYWRQVIADAPPVLVRAERGRAPAVNVERLLACPLALRRRWLRLVLDGLGIAPDSHTAEGLLALAEMGNGARFELPHGWVAYRAFQDFDDAPRTGATARRGPVLRFEQAADLAGFRDFAYPFPVPGSVTVPELGVVFRASVVSLAAGGQAYNRAQLFARHLGPVMQVRNWRPGERFVVHGNSMRKVKELLQAKRISGPERAVWPVVVSAAGEVVWMRGFEVPECFVPASGEAEGIFIQEQALAEAGE